MLSGHIATFNTPDCNTNSTNCVRRTNETSINTDGSGMVASSFNVPSSPATTNRDGATMKQIRELVLRELTLRISEATRRAVIDRYTKIVKDNNPQVNVWLIRSMIRKGG